ncbi:RcpC/CpaB family pilus assembly protein [Streptomyces sp. AK02-01A]|nr:RcpC/CpaB family pilus assembly protein [Streptomyces sp. AK02-01A]MDX3854182.1 RcpC/CpaB family pilus assembly protein [Streptomyces sp. AK02-01A]
MPPFDPLRVRGSGQRLRRAVLRRRRAMAAGLAMSAAALAATGAGGAVGAATGPDARSEAAAGAVAAGLPERQLAAEPVEMVSAPVRIADAATVGLLRPGDKVDVIAAPAAPPGLPGAAEGPAEARVVAAGARVAEIPQERETTSDGGALVVLSVPRATATALAGAGATSRLAVTLC